MNDHDFEQLPRTPGSVEADNAPGRQPTIPMRVFFRSGATLCASLLVIFFVACWKFTDGAFPIGIKRYALFGLISMFIAVRLLAGPAQSTDQAQFRGRLSVLQMLIVIVGGSSSGAFLTWFFHG